MVGCNVIGCKSRSERKITGITFHSFPSNPNTRLKWVEATGKLNWPPTINSKMCSLHFGDEMFIHKDKLVLLKPNSVPVKHIHVKPMEMQSEESRSSKMTQIVVHKDQNNVNSLINSQRLFLDASINANIIINPNDSKLILHKKRDAKREQNLFKRKVLYHSCNSVHQIFTLPQETCLRDFIIDCANKFNGLKRKDGQCIAYQMARINKIFPIPSLWKVNKMASKNWLQGFESRHMHVMLKKTDELSRMNAPKFNRRNFFMDLNALTRTCVDGYGVTFYLDENLEVNIRPIPEMKVYAVKKKTLATSNISAETNNTEHAEVKTEDENSFDNTNVDFTPQMKVYVAKKKDVEKKSSITSSDTAQICNDTPKVKIVDKISFENSSIDFLENCDLWHTPVADLTIVKSENSEETDTPAEATTDSMDSLFLSSGVPAIEKTPESILVTELKQELQEMEKKLKHRDKIIRTILQDKNMKIKRLRKSLLERNVALNKKDKAIQRMKLMNHQLSKKNRMMKLIFTKMKKITF